MATTGGSGLDATALRALRDRIQAEIDNGVAPAAQFALARNGELVAFESFGTATDSTRFALFSATKAWIAGVVWQLIGEGLLAPETLVVDVIPGFGSAGRSADVVGRLTLEHVLTHTGGFPYAPLGPPEWSDRSSRLDKMTRWRLDTQPGERFEYHATAAHWVAAEMIEATTGRNYLDEVRGRVTEPLGLPAFVLGPPGGELTDVAELVATGAPPTSAELIELFGNDEILLFGDITPDLLLGFNDPQSRDVGLPGGGGIGTAADLALLYQGFLHNPAGLWEPSALQDGTGNVRCTLPDPMRGHASNRTLGLVVAGDDGNAALRGMGHVASPRTFGHNGAAGQIAWADPDSGLSFGFTICGIDRDFLAEGRRTASLSSRAAATV
jgi:CubicO group peptidase (beta-lactamase class C family)